MLLKKKVKIVYSMKITILKIVYANNRFDIYFVFIST